MMVDDGKKETTHTHDIDSHVVTKARLRLSKGFYNTTERGISGGNGLGRNI